MASEKKRTKFIFVTGGVVSSLGKGLASASIGALLESRGLKVTVFKMDPYINVDPGTMSPFQHGEVFVTDDGAETDLDLGHYERFTVLAHDARRTTSPPVRSTTASSPTNARGNYLGAYGAGHPAHHRRDQAPHPARPRTATILPSVEDRGNGW